VGALERYPGEKGKVIRVISENKRGSLRGSQVKKNWVSQGGKKDRGFQSHQQKKSSCSISLGTRGLRFTSNEKKDAKMMSERTKIGGDVSVSKTRLRLGAKTGLDHLSRNAQGCEQTEEASGFV